MKRLRRIAPFIISLILVLVLVSYAPWAKVARILGDFDLSTIFLLLGLSLIYYGLKSYRFWWLLRAMHIHKPLSLVTLSYISAQPVSLLPAGEIYRSNALERYTDVPVKQSLPQFTIQGLLEGIAMGTLALISAWTLGTLRIAAIGLTIVALLSLIGLRKGYFKYFIAVINRLPFLNVTAETVERFNRQHRDVLSRRNLPALYGQSLLIELSGTAIAYVSVVGIGGHINLFQAALLYVIPVIVGFISLLPGGLGISEQSAIGVLVLSDVSVEHAVAATLIMRVTIVGLGVVYGGIALIIGHVRLYGWTLRPAAESLTS